MMLLQLRKRRCKQGRQSSSVYKEKRAEAKQTDGWTRRRGDALARGTASSQLCILLHSLSHLAALCSCIQHLHPLCACTHSHKACCPVCTWGGGAVQRENMRGLEERKVCCANAVIFCCRMLTWYANENRLWASQAAGCHTTALPHTRTAAGGGVLLKLTGWVLIWPTGWPFFSFKNQCGL